MYEIIETIVSHNICCQIRIFNVYNVRVNLIARYMWCIEDMCGFLYENSV